MLNSHTVLSRGREAPRPRLNLLRQQTLEAGAAAEVHAQPFQARDGALQNHSARLRLPRRPCARALQIEAFRGRGVGGGGEGGSASDLVERREEVLPIN